MDDSDIVNGTLVGGLFRPPSSMPESAVEFAEVEESFRSLEEASGSSITLVTPPTCSLYLTLSSSTSLSSSLSAGEEDEEEGEEEEEVWEEESAWE